MQIQENHTLLLLHANYHQLLQLQLREDFFSINGLYSEVQCSISKLILPNITLEDIPLFPWASGCNISLQLQMLFIRQLWLYDYLQIFGLMQIMDQLFSLF